MEGVKAFEVEEELRYLRDTLHVMIDSAQDDGAVLEATEQLAKLISLQTGINQAIYRMKNPMSNVFRLMEGEDEE